MDDCWPWLHSVGSHGYGQKFSAGGPKLAHRLAYEKYKGAIPPGLHVLHTCDNPGCVNPEHLFLGTARDNAIDRELKGRGNHAKGTEVGSAKLTEEDVLYIRRSTETQRALGRKFDVAHTTIGAILRGKNWKTVC